MQSAWEGWTGTLSEGTMHSPGLFLNEQGPPKLGMVLGEGGLRSTSLKERQGRADEWSWLCQGLGQGKVFQPAPGKPNLSMLSWVVYVLSIPICDMGQWCHLTGGWREGSAAPSTDLKGKSLSLPSTGPRGCGVQEIRDDPRDKEVTAPTSCRHQGGDHKQQCLTLNDMDGEYRGR